MNLLFTDNHPPVRANSFLRYTNLKTETLDPIPDLGSLADYLSKTVNNIDSNTSISNIILPINLHGLYSEFIGLRLAYYIRTSMDNNINKANLIFYGSETIREAFRYSDYANILVTQGAQIVPFEKAAFENLLQLEKELKNETELLTALKKIAPPKPFNVYGSHGLANEWCFHRLLEVIGKKSSQFDKLKQKLYFRYLDAITKREKIRRKDIDDFRYASNIRVCLIDDQLKNGSREFFGELFGNENIFAPIISGKSREEVKQGLFEKIFDQSQVLRQFDSFILDLRLYDGDHEINSSSEISDLTGFHILKMILHGGKYNGLNYTGNQAAQVIVLSASNKSWVCKYALENGATDFITKEDPTKGYSRSESIDLFNQIVRSVNDSLERKALFRAFKTLDDFAKCQIINNDQSLLNDLTEFKNHLLIFKNGSIKRAIELGFNILDKISSNKENITVAGTYIKVKLQDGSEKQVYQQIDFKVVSEIEIAPKVFYFHYPDKSYQAGIFKINKDSKLEIGRFQENKPDNNAILRAVSLLYYRYKVDVSIINDLLTLRCIRSQLVAHNTGNIDSSKIDFQNYDMTVKPFIDVFEKISQIES